MTEKSNQKNATTRRKFIKTAGGIGAGSAAMLAGINQSASAKSKGKPVVVGGPLPLTGGVAADGIEFRRGLEMAADEINAAGGILGRPIKLAFEDTETKGDDVISRAGQRLVDRENASVLISGYNLGTYTALQNVAADSSVIYMHADTAIAHTELIKKNPKKYWGSFMYCPSEAFYGFAYLDYVKHLETTGQFKAPNKKIALITGPISYSINIANAIRDKAKEYGYEISLYETVQAPTSEWGPTLAKLRKDQPGQIVVTHFFPQDQAQFMLQFMNKPTNSLVYMQYGASLAAFRDIAGKASEGVLYATNIGALNGEIATEFKKNYYARNGKKASPNGGGQTYSALHMYAIAAAMAGGPGDPYDDKQNRKIAERLKGLIYRSPMGAIRINPENNAAYSYPVQTNDPSLGMSHIFSQIKKKEENGHIISPTPYDVAKFEKPSWMK